MATLLDVIGPRNGTAPLTVTITDAGTVDLQSIFAHFDGTSASGIFRPVVTIRSQNGTILARVFPSTTLAVGDTADVTYAPFLGDSQGAVTASLGLLDYAEFTSTIQVLSTDKNNPTNLVTGNAITLDGSTVIEVSGYCPIIDAGTTGPPDAVRVQLWDGVTPIGVISHIGANYTGTEIAAGGFGAVTYTPAAGTHTYSLKAYHLGAGATGYVIAGSVSFLPDAVVPGYVKVIAYAS